VSFEIELPLFKGPFDLLLFFIERDELDVNDIPISTITKNFLDYLEHLEKMNIEVASEFILVAATLMKIKSKLLVPRPELDPHGNEIDPREELVQRLLEYKKYKSVLQDLSTMEQSQLAREKRGNIATELKKLAEITNVEAELQHVDLYKLMKVFEKALKRSEDEKNQPVHQVVQYPFTIRGQKETILSRLEHIEKLSFTDLIQENRTKIALVFNFLAILELLQLKLILIQIGLGYNNFWIARNTEE
jgi:segregation and condensation protein A